METMIPRILIRHLTGSKANRIEQFQLEAARELIIGRGSAANVTFDGELEDSVSRRHAIIKIKRSDGLSFTIADLGSSNGVRVNGKPVRFEQALLPDDIVELGPGGPAFKIAVEPESLYVGDEAPVRRGPVHTTDDGSPGRDQIGLRRGVGQPQASAVKDGEKRRLKLRYSYLVLLTAALTTGIMATRLGTGALAYRYVTYLGHSWMDRLAQAPTSSGSTAKPVAVHVPLAAPAPSTQPVRPVASPPPSAPPVETAKTASGAIVYLEARWRLYDKFTGQPVFQKTVTRKGLRLPCFVELAGARIVPWLTTKDEEHTNSPVGGVIRGIGFIISGTGAIITSRRIAAGWTVKYHLATTAEHKGLLFRAADDPVREAPSTIVDLAAPGGSAWLTDWTPGVGGSLFHSRYPVPLGAAGNDFEGRNDSLDAQLASSHVGAQAHVTRISADADLAELKIDVDRPLPVVALSDDTDARVGARVTALGYAGSLDASLDQAAAIDMAEVTGLEGRLPNPPPVVSAEGAIIGVDRTVAFPDAVAGAAAGSSGDIYRLSMKGPYPADGGPVLDDSGRALGVLVSDTTGQTTQVYAYSMRLVRALLQSQ